MAHVDLLSSVTRFLPAVRVITVSTIAIYFSDWNLSNLSTSPLPRVKIIILQSNRCVGRHAYQARCALYIVA